MAKDEVTYSEEYAKEFFDRLEPVLREIWDDEGFVIGAFIDCKGEIRNIDRLLKFIKDNPGVDSDEVIMEGMCIHDGEDVRNYDHPDYKGQTPRKY